MILRGGPAPPRRHRTLVHALAAAAGHPSGVTFVDLSERERFLPWREVRERAGRAAAALAAMGVHPGDRVAIVLRTEPAFLDAFFGAWLAGAVPVPLYPPVRLGRMDEYAAGTGRMLAISGARLVLSGGAVKRLLGEAVERGGPELGCRDAGELVAGAARLARAPEPAELALVQFSSGSTVDPKPVALTHDNVVAQVASFLGALVPGDDDAGVGNTEQAARALGRQLDLDDAAIRRDLERQRDEEFERTRVYRRVFEIADAKRGTPLPHASLPRIRIEGPKISRTLTNEWFAKRVDERYQRCLDR